MPCLLEPALGEAAAIPALQVSPLHLGSALLAAAAAGFGALAFASLVGYSPARLSQHLEETRRPDRADRAAEIARRETEYLAVATCYTAFGWGVGVWSVANAVGAANRPAAFVVFVVAMLVVAGSLPLSIAQVRAERALLAVLPIVRGGWFLLRWPVVLPLLAITRLCLHVLRIRPDPRPDTANVQKQVMAAVADTVADETLPHSERTWIGNIVALKDLQVSTVMTPRPDIIAFADSTPLREAVEKALAHGFSRYPVYRDRIDEITGIFHVKDALRLLPDARQAQAPVRPMLREPLFVPETTGVALLLRRFQAGHQHLAIVIDEYGTTAGLVTVRDILEEIVGDIGTEYESAQDTADREQIRVVEARRVVEIPARTTVAELNGLLGTQLADGSDYDTVAGLMIGRFNHIPVVDETIVVDGVEFRVLQADARRVQRVRATTLAPEPAEGTG
ncbi:MAG TPA: hemolysin family protein [Planctomycetota bacterium]|nr:hemolysin family protein [Planctomycetota bacterium]